MNNYALPWCLVNKIDPMLKPSWDLSRCLLKILEDLGHCESPIQSSNHFLFSACSTKQQVSETSHQCFKIWASCSICVPTYLMDQTYRYIYIYIIYMFYPIYLTIDRSTYLCPSIFSIYLLIIDESTYLSIYPNIYLSIYSIHWYIHLSYLISSHLILSYLILSYPIYLCIYLSILALPTLHFLIYLSIPWGHHQKSPVQDGMAVPSRAKKHRDQMYVTSWWNLDDSWVQVVHHHPKNLWMLHIS